VAKVSLTARSRENKTPTKVLFIFFLLTDDSAISQQLPTTHNKLAYLLPQWRSSIFELPLLTTPS
jgi:hypothetical protein